MNPVITLGFFLDKFYDSDAWEGELNLNTADLVRYSNRSQSLWRTEMVRICGAEYKKKDSCTENDLQKSSEVSQVFDWM